MNKKELKEFEALCEIRGTDPRAIKSAWLLLEFLTERKRLGCIGKISIIALAKCTKLNKRTVVSARNLLFDLGVINYNWEIVE